MPPAAPGLSIGLFGGSFNPAHEGHRLVAEIALRQIGLDRLWWIVTPGNPLKEQSELRPLSERIAGSRAMARDPRITVTAFEVGIVTRYTADTLEQVKRRHPATRFVWLMGADNLRSFHRWQQWTTIAETFPIGIIDRPGSTLATLSSPMAKRFARYRMDESDATRLPFADPPAWTFIHGQRSAQSSSAIRDALRR